MFSKSDQTRLDSYTREALLDTIGRVQEKLAAAEAGLAEAREVLAELVNATTADPPHSWDKPGYRLHDATVARRVLARARALAAKEKP